MKFIKPLLSFMCIALALSGCGSTPKKPPVDGGGSSANKIAEQAKANELPQPTTTVQSSVLPVGPVTPNPYLQNPQKQSEQVEINFHDAVASMQQKNWGHAESVLLQLAEKNPKLSGVYLNLGIVYRNKGDMEKAAVEFNKAITANPKNVDAYNHLAVLKREAGDFSSAESLYKKALNVWPFYAEGHKNIAILYDLYLGKPDLALPHYQAYQQLLSSPDKQVESWVADLQRRLNGAKAPEKEEQK